MEERLSERERDILLKVAELYIETGEPVGSRTVQKTYGMKISSATIRNVMADLEDKGFLSQPHVSAGRVPTDEGLKVYINHLFLATGSEDATITSRLLSFVQGAGASKPEEVLSRVLSFLQNYTGYLGFGVNFVENLLVRSVTLVKVSKEKVLMILRFSPDYIVHRVVELDVPEAGVGALSRELTRRFKGKTLKELKKELLEEIDTARREFASLSLKMNSQILSTLSGVEHIELQGTSNIVDVLASDLEKLKEILKVLEEKSLLLKILSRFFEENKRIGVILGSETELKPLEPFSIVMGKFRTGGRNGGVVGIIGPKRMNYSEVIPVVENVARALTQLMSGEVR